MPDINNATDINISALSFDEAKANLISFLSNQTELSDYSFTGSAMNVVIDMLTYTTHLIGTYNNLSLSEVYLDSAQLRNSVVSKAKELNYMPRQVQSAVAVLDITLDDGIDRGNNFTIPKATKFTSVLDGVSYEFTTTDDTTLSLVNGTTQYTSNSIEVYQGSYITERWTVAVASGQKYIISNKGCDTRFFTVDIAAQSGSSDIARWTENKDITLIDSSSTVYFMQEAPDEKVEIYFGDGITGQLPVNNNVISVEYLLSKGSVANGCGVFELVNDIGSISRSNFIISTVESATEGADLENIETVKLLAPKAYQAQGRAVTPTDYEQIIRSTYGSIESINIWGGEDNDPPQYGKVYVCIKPIGAEEVSPATKARITESISGFNVTGVSPVVVSPDYTYINVDTIISVDMNQSTLDRGQLETVTIQTIKDYFTSNLNTFSTAFRYSRISRDIDDTDTAIVSNRSTVTVSKKFQPDVANATTYEMNLNGAIVAGSIVSDQFGFETDEFEGVLKIKDDGLGNLQYIKTQSYYDTSGNLQYIETILDSNIGTVDYATGNISIVSFLFVTPNDTTIVITGTPVVADVESIRTNLLVVGNVSVTLEE